jgi:pantoate--beta-alanine ligase
MITVRTTAELRAALAPAKRTGVAGFVPTMGALHDGHAALMRQARRECGIVAASIFVNPAQFNDPADLAAYPRTEAHDAALAAHAGVDVLFVPAVDEVYPPGHATTVHVEGAALGFEGEHRPGHFDGVALVCLTLFSMVQPDRVYLGQKDAQQVAVLQQLVRDLRLPLDVVVAPTVRDPDGLAMSSRNVRLSAGERQRALAIPRALERAVRAKVRGEDPVAAARAELEGLEVEYVDVASFAAGPTLVIAARVGRTRLIDNVPLEHPKQAGMPHAARGAAR